MKSNLVEKLTREYKIAVEKEWALLYANDAEIQLEDSFAAFQKVSRPSETSVVDNEKLFTLSDIFSTLKVKSLHKEQEDQA